MGRLMIRLNGKNRRNTWQCYVWERTERVYSSKFGNSGDILYFGRLK